MLKCSSLHVNYKRVHYQIPETCATLLYNRSSCWGIVTSSRELPDLSDYCGKDKSKKLELQPGGRGKGRACLDAECRLQTSSLPAVQGRWKTFVQLKMRALIPGEMNTRNSKGINDSSVLIAKESKNIYFWKYGKLGAVLVGKESSGEELSESREHVNIIQQLYKRGKLNMPLEMGSC